MRPEYGPAVAAWRDHLRQGGTTTWADFVPDEDVDASGALPAPANLELVRRLNLAGAGFDPDLVLGVAAPGRGMVEEKLPWPEPGTHHRTPLQPDAFPEGEILRVAAAATAQLLRGLPAPQRSVVRRRRVHALGAPLDTAELQATLRAPRLRRWTRDAVIVAPGWSETLTQCWSARVQRGGLVTWGHFVRRGAGEPQRALRLDLLVDQARQWHRPGRIHLALGAAQPHELASELGARPAEGVPVLRHLRPAAVEFLRHVNLATRLWGDPSATAVRQLVIERLAPGRGALGVAPDLSPGLWLQASSILDRAVSSGVRIHGDPDGWVASVDSGAPPRPSRGAAAALAVSTLRGVLEEVG